MLACSVHEPVTFMGGGLAALSTLLARAPAMPWDVPINALAVIVPP